MVKEEIRIRKVILHILDSTAGMPVLSDQEAEFGSEFADFLREHIFRIAGGDESKNCRFYEEQSELFQLLEQYEDEAFVPVSQKIAGLLYEIMNANVDIPSADLLVVRFREGEEEYLALLKMNFKESYTHRAVAAGEGNRNEIVRYKAVLPGQTQRLSEAAVIRLSDRAIRLVEKKYEINGEKTDYFSGLFLKCAASLSPKSKLGLVTKAVDTVQKAYYGEADQYGAQMEAKSIIQEELQEKGGFVVEQLAERIFHGDTQMQTAFQDQMEKYDLVKEEVKPGSETTLRKFEKQHLLTDTGIEIKIPMEQYRDSGSVEFINNPDGTISVLIKNIGHLQARF